MMALGIQQNLEAFLPDPTVRPIERVGVGAGERKRARPTLEANDGGTLLSDTILAGCVDCLLEVPYLPGHGEAVKVKSEGKKGIHQPYTCESEWRSNAQAHDEKLTFIDYVGFSSFFKYLIRVRMFRPLMVS